MRLILSSSEHHALETVLVTLSAETGENLRSLDSAVAKAGGTVNHGLGSVEVNFHDRHVIALLRVTQGALRIGFQLGKTFTGLIEVAKGALQNLERQFKEEIQRDEPH